MYYLEFIYIIFGPAKVAKLHEENGLADTWVEIIWLWVAMPKYTKRFKQKKFINMINIKKSGFKHEHVAFFF